MSGARVETVAPVVRRVRAYFAPSDRATETAVLFDPAQMGSFAVGTPPAPWLDLGWVRNFKRVSGTKLDAVRAGSPATTVMQVRTEVEASVSMEFSRWGKLQLALTAGTQQMNLLRAAAGAAAAGSGGAALAAAPLVASSTASVLQVGAAAAGFAVGEWVSVDVDYVGQTGFVGSGVSGAYVRSVLSDIDYVRRVTLNVGRIAAISGGALTLESALLAGVPSSGLKVSGLVGFCDREGSSFFQEWSALFVLEGQQGERVLLHYPRLQAATGAAEAATSEGGLETLRLAGTFRALAVKDAIDGEQVVCFRSYLPA